jgi:hypothetical protein
MRIEMLIMIKLITSDRTMMKSNQLTSSLMNLVFITRVFITNFTLSR